MSIALANSANNVRVTVTQMRTEDPTLFLEDWKNLKLHISSNPTDILVLPEFPFTHWFIANKPQNAKQRSEIWEQSSIAHQQWIKQHFAEMPVKTIVSSIPVIHNGIQLNEFYTYKNTKYTPVHYKYYLPEEPGVWEQSWYSRGDGVFDAFNITDQVKGGALLCSELWFMQRAREYGKQVCFIITTDLMLVEC
jgi:predicted amidohydrolase